MPDDRILERVDHQAPGPPIQATTSRWSLKLYQRAGIGAEHHESLF